LRGLFCAIALVSAACAPVADPSATPKDPAVTLIADGQQLRLTVPAGATVSQVLARQGISLGPLDRVTPAETAQVATGSLIRVTRGEERFEVERVTVPFERQTIRNEALLEGETRLIQPGMNGEQEVTYRILLEDGRQTIRELVQGVILHSPVSEIVMVGGRSPLPSVPLVGTLAYLTGGNAWAARGSSGARQPLTLSGDLDGRVFALSPDGEWLLFSRRLGGEDRINSLWAVSTGPASPVALELGINNIIHFAEWSPVAPRTFAYSTVEPRTSPPGWQANNDLYLATLGEGGLGLVITPIMGPSAGGLYGWWGPRYAWSADGTRLAIARADSLGIVTLATGTETVLKRVVPFHTTADWVWLPPANWSPDGLVLYTVEHGGSSDAVNPEASQEFHLSAVSTWGGWDIRLASDSGLFAMPLPSPPTASSGGELPHSIAYLQALEPDQSLSSRYRLWVMDRDGSGARSLFQPSGAPGLEPAGQLLAWSPDGSSIALVYQGNLWVVEVATGLAQQLTDDGLASAPRWSR